MMMTANLFAVEKQDIMPFITAASTATGKAYVEVRNKIVEYDVDALPLLDAIAIDETLTWQQQLVARICHERIGRKADIEKLLATDWRKHPNFSGKWFAVVGLSIHAIEIITADLRDLGLWYYYLEVEWKTTGEVVNSGGDDWTYLYTLTVKDSPERVWLLRVFDEMIETTPPPPRLHWLFTTLMNEQKNDTADVLEKYNRKFPPALPNPQPQHIANEPDPIAERAAAEALKALQKAQQERAATEN